MALIIDSVKGSATANSYVTLAEAETYFEGRLYSDKWTALTTDNDKNIALATATRRLEQEEYRGYRIDTTTPQALAFPREGLDYLDGVDLNDSIPSILKEAQFELTLHMLKTDMSEIGIEPQIKSKGIGSMKKEYHYDDNDNSTLSNDALPPFVVSLLADITTSLSSGIQIDIGR